MMISASRRTDIPAFYSQWFINRLKKGYVLVPNPYNQNQVSKICLSPDVVDCIVFWTKNPAPLISKLHEIDTLGYKYYFQFTVTSYDQSMEKKVASKNTIIKTFQRLSEQIGKEKVIWRYDPILLTDTFNVEYHEEWFKDLAGQLSNYTKKCIISFIDMYKKCERNLNGFKIQTPNEEKKRHVSEKLSKIARYFDLPIESCAEPSLSSYGVDSAKCIDDRLISKIIGSDLKIKKDRTQRKGCGCVTSIDIGSYNTCKHGCKYCYANSNQKIVINNWKKHDKDSPMLTGNLNGNAKVNIRKVESFCLK